MAKMKTVPTDNSVTAFLDKIDNAKKREDADALLAMFKQITKMEPVMWGPSIIGFGSYHYKYESGREGDMPLTGFSPRAQNFSLYCMPGFDQVQDLLDKLGKHKTGKSCLYIKKLDDIDYKVLKQLIKRDFDLMVKKYGRSE